MHDSSTVPEALATDLLPSEQLALDVAPLGPVEAAEALLAWDDDLVFDTLRRLNPVFVGDILPELPRERRDRILARGPSPITRQWALNQGYEEDTVGRLLEPAVAAFEPEATVAQVTERLREIVRRYLVTYIYVTDAEGRLSGVVTMRDLLFSDEHVRMDALMLREVFALHPTMPVMEAMRAVVHRHYPVYPVTDDDGRLVGTVRGRVLFEAQAIEIGAQAGRMVGVDREERISTPWLRSLVFRHPWLQLNLLTAFVAAAVVGVFQDTLDQMVVLALFLPVLAGQSGNTGCQALAVTLRGMTLGELDGGAGRRLVTKEALLGCVNGVLVGVTAGVGMYLVATSQANPAALGLAGIVALAMTASCVVSGVAGAMIPLTLKRIGADPATASSIFLTTATDVASMGLFLGMATLLLF